MLTPNLPRHARARRSKSSAPAPAAAGEAKGCGNKGTFVCVRIRIRIRIRILFLTKAKGVELRSLHRADTLVLLAPTPAPLVLLAAPPLHHTHSTTPFPHRAISLARHLLTSPLGRPTLPRSLPPSLPRPFALYPTQLTLPHSTSPPSSPPLATNQLPFASLPPPSPPPSLPLRCAHSLTDCSCGTTCGCAPGECKCAKC